MPTLLQPTRLAAVLCLAALTTASAQQGGPTLGTKPAGIVDGKGQVVGGGKSLTITGPAPKSGADPRDRYAEGVRFLATFLDQLNALQKDTVQVKMALR